MKKIVTNIIPMKKKHLQLTLDWAGNEGWNPGLYEANLFAPNHSYKMYALELNNKMIASISIIQYSKNFSFLGLYIVTPELREQGYGKALWNAALEKVRGCQTIGLNSVLPQINMYKKSDFLPHSLNLRWRGNLSSIQELKGNTTNIKLATEKEVTDIIRFDEKLFFTSRKEFLKKWISMPASTTLVATKNGVICGYGVISATKNDYKIAPLFADNKAIARDLFITLCSFAKNSNFVFFDTTENNPEAIELANDLNLQIIFKTMRMYKGSIPEQSEDKIFGLTSLEFG